MNIVFYSTNDLPVAQRVDDSYISLTDMAKSQRKRLDNWLRLKETASLLREFKQSLEYEGLEPVVTIEGRNGGTWGHPDIAIQFAQWCSPKFALQVSRWVGEWLTTRQNPLNTTQQISSARQRLIEAHILRTQALNRTIHTAIHQQTDAIRDTLNTLDSRIQSQTVVIQTADTNSNSHKLKQLLPKSSSGQTPELSSPDDRPWLLIVERDKSLAKALVVEAATWGMRAEIATTPTLVRERISSARPDIVLLDLCANTPQENLTLLAELHACTPPVPVLVLADRDRLIDRVKVARLGGRGFLSKPVTPAFVLEAVTALLQRDRTTAAKVMVVDDDSQVLTALHSLLKPWGIKLSTLDCPLQFWDNLEAFAPDLLILDVEMPQISGIELCQSVRADMRWSGLPILFLTAHTDADTMQQVFAAGGDDYVSKPIVGPELVTRILNRLE